MLEFNMERTYFVRMIRVNDPGKHYKNLQVFDKIAVSVPLEELYRIPMNTQTGLFIGGSKSSVRLEYSTEKFEKLPQLPGWTQQKEV